ncbi:tape measure domain-containing protein [Faunimonas pinastri]|uniref:Tape measure domain-containing protein n=1 Tax=Faunimonas pinastri TaxID=1855383 RepID=A0A1H9MQL7_9HYPH|nr:tape measure protein [Faunimonas pinastri]SER25767.1 tape measure domain-containing protein [Faunimonas pinastri]
MAGIRVELELDTGEFTSRILHAGQSVQQFQSTVNGNIVALERMTDSSKGFLGTLRDVSIVAGVATGAFGKLHDVATGWLGDIIKVNAEMERLTKQLQGMSKAADPIKDAADQVDWLRQKALQVPYSLQGMTKAYVQLKSTGIDPMAGSMQALMDGVAAMGGTDETLQRATLAISQMAGKGVIQMEELRQQLGEAMPRATELMARSMGVSVTELFQKINTGTVQARPAIEALSLEMERAFGGAAQAQMSTWNGLISNVNTNMQSLALKVGQAGFFDTVKQQVIDLNNLLSGQFANGLADSLGRGLSSLITGFREVIETAIEYRGVIEQVGAVFVAWFGGKMVLALHELIASGFTELGLQLQLLRNQASVVGNAFAGWGGAVTGIRSLRDALAAVSLTSEGLASVAPMLLTGFTSIVGILPALGMGVVAVANYFGLFQDKARDAWQELEKFGAVSRKQIEDASGYVKEQQAQLDKLYAQRDQLKKAGFDTLSENDPNRQWYDDTLQQIADLEAKIPKLREKLDTWTGQQEKDEVSKGLQLELSRIQDSLTATSRAYDQQARVAADAHDKQVRELSTAHKSIKDEDERYQQESRKAALDFYDKQIADLETYLTHYQEQAANAVDAVQKGTALSVADNITGQIRTLQQQRESTRSLISGVPMAPKAVNDDKAFQKGAQLLESLTDKATAYKAALQGADVEVMNLTQLLQNGKYGDMGRQEVQDLTDKLIAAKAEVRELQELMEGRNKLDNDLRAAQASAEESYYKEVIRSAELGKTKLTETDKIAIGVKAGLYKGVGPNATPMQRAVEGINTQLANTQTAAQNAARTMQSTVFGGPIINAANTLINAVQRLNEAWSSFRGNVSGTNVAGALSFDPSAVRSIGGAFSSLSGIIPGAGFLGKLIHSESSGNANAQSSTSSALGAAQFIKGTWMQFIREMHSELIQKDGKGGVMNSAQLLDMRRNAAMSVEAATWYANKNAQVLQSKGFQANDWQLKLAHMLDSSGALKVLQAAPDTLLSALLGADQISANKWQNVTAGQLKSRLAAQFGSNRTFAPTTAPIAGGQYAGPKNPGDPTLAAPAGLNGDEVSQFNATQQIEQLANAKKLENDLAETFLKTKDAIAQATEKADGFGAHVSALRKQIKEGVYGADKNPDSDRYKELIKLTKDWDDADAKAKKNQRLRSSVDSGQDRLASQAKEAADKQAEAMARLNDPSATKQSDGYFSLSRQWDDQIQKLGELYGKDSQNYKDALEQKKVALQNFQNSEVTSTIAGLAQQDAELERSLMAQGAARDNSLQQEIDRTQKLLDNFKGSAEERQRLEDAIQKHIRLVREKTAQESPIAKELQQYADFGGNLQKGMAGWIDSGLDGLATFVTTGKADFASLTQSILKDLAKMSLQWATSGLTRSLKGGGAGKGAAAGGGAGKGGGLAKLTGTAHTGGVIGASNLRSTMVNPAIFANAPKFHTGGVIRGRGLGPDEVPIVARRGEGVFTPEQMAAMGSAGGGNMQAITINSPVTVNASGGTHDQNADLAKQVSKQVEGSMRSLVVNELQKQMRPGGIAYGRR